jgi:heptaprenylglyceryl phosphate synthase
MVSKMKKLCILLDPSKPQIARVYEEVKKLKEEILPSSEFWVGCTLRGWKEKVYWLERLKEIRAQPRFLFAAKLEDILVVKHADYLLAPTLLNYSKSLAPLKTKVGKLLASFPPFKGKARVLNYGYLVLSGESSVGRRIGAREIGDEIAAKLARNFLEKEKKTFGIYIEGGSGARQSIAKRLGLVRSIDELLGEKILMVGGGIRRKKEVEELVCYADRIVVGTHFERKPEDLLRFYRVIEGSN